MVKLPSRIKNDGKSRRVVKSKNITGVLEQARQHQLLRPAAERWERILKSPNWWPKSNISPRPSKYPVRSGLIWDARVHKDRIRMNHRYDYPLYVNRRHDYLERSYHGSILPHIKRQLIKKMDKQVTKKLKRL